MDGRRGDLYSKVGDLFCDFIFPASLVNVFTSVASLG